MKLKIGVIAGAFDLIHFGVIHMFEEAYNNCDKLIVLLHKDPSVENNKLQPVQSIDIRKYILKAIRYVDDVKVYETENDLISWLEYIEPDIRFLGDDYKGKKFTGMELNIPIHFINRDHGWSTTRLKQMICDQIMYNLEKEYMEND